MRIKQVFKSIGIGVLLVVATVSSMRAQEKSSPTLEATLRLENREAVDQDDHCIWVHPTKPSESRIICSDKSANKIFTYSVRGEVKQTIDVPFPGNIDCRQNVQLPSGELIDVVLVNLRETRPALQLFEVNRLDGKLVELGPPIPTGENYGCCLYYDKKKLSLYGIITAKSGGIEQYLLGFDSDKKLTSQKVRSWRIGFCEGAVADDESGQLYIAEEDGVVWKFNADPSSEAKGEALCRIGQLGLRGNLEGLTLLQVPTIREKCLVISDQGRSRYVVISTTSPTKKVLEFAIAKGLNTDGIDIVQASLGDEFPAGIFIAHTDSDRRQPVVVDLRKLLSQITLP